MKDFKHWGIKKRSYPDHNYNAVWFNLKTIRLGTGVAKELPIDQKEFLDISLGTRCNSECRYCYISASKKGVFYDNICENIKFFIENMDQPIFQGAIGSEGEPTLHPEFLKFIETMYNCGVVPNYTTNGITIARDDEYSKAIIETTQRYCGGVAISTHPHLTEHWEKAVQKLIDAGDININLHYIISDRASVDRFKAIYDKYKDDILYFVMLPLMPSGRSTEKYDPEAFDYLLEIIPDFSKIAFGAHFYEDVLRSKDKIQVWEYPPESLSANLVLSDPIKLTKSSFDLEPVLEIPFEL